MANGVRSKYCDARFALPRARFLEGMKLHSRSVLGDTTGELGAVSWHIGRFFHEIHGEDHELQGFEVRLSFDPTSSPVRNLNGTRTTQT